MTDLEITKLCAQAMEFKHWGMGYNIPGTEDIVWYQTEGHGERAYVPLINDAQAMALVYWLAMRGVLAIGERHLLFDYGDFERQWQNYDGSKDGMRRAICECVAKMQAAKASAPSAAV